MTRKETLEMLQLVGMTKNEILFLLTALRSKSTKEKIAKSKFQRHCKFLSNTRFTVYYTHANNVNAVSVNRVI